MNNLATIKELWVTTGEIFHDHTSAAWDSTAGFREKTKTVAKNAWDATTNKTKDAWDVTANKTKDAFDKTGDFAKESWSKTKDATKSAWDKTSSFFSNIVKRGKILLSLISV